MFNPIGILPAGRGGRSFRPAQIRPGADPDVHRGQDVAARYLQDTDRHRPWRGGADPAGLHGAESADDPQKGGVNGAVKRAPSGALFHVSNLLSA